MWGQEVTGVWGEERAGGTLLERYEPLCANVPRREKKRHSHASRDCTRDEVGSDSKSPCAARAQSSLVHRVSSIDDLPAFAGEETTEPCVSATTVDVSSGRQPTLPWKKRSR